MHPVSCIGGAALSEASHELLARLAREADESMTSVLDAALETYRRQRFLTALDRLSARILNFWRSLTREA